MKYMFFLSIIIINSCYSQNENILLKNYSTFKEILQEIEIKGNQYASWELSRIGEYEEAKKIFEESKDYEFDEIKQNQNNYHFYNAISVVDSISKNQRAIFINEAHHVSQHRNFIRYLLPILFNNGYTFLGMEAFNSKDTLITKRGYPIKESGFYTKDPEYAELIRDAILIGFKIFGYEAKRGENGKEREISQAENIYNIIKADSTSKVLIIAGFDHIREDTLLKSWGKAMAVRFFEFSGINPITFDQVEFTTKFFDYNTNPIWKTINPINSVIPISENGNFKNPYSTKMFDYYIFHPKPNLVDSIPIWKYSYGRTPYFVKENFINPNENYIIIAYDYAEFINEKKNTLQLIPKDIVSIKDNNKPLLLKPGKYYIEIINSSKKIIFSQTLTHK